MRPLLMLAALLTTVVPAVHAADPLIFISAFAAGTNGGIHAFTLDAATGRLKPLQRTAGVEHPFFLAVSPDQKYLYSIHAKNFGGKEPEHVAAYALEGRTGGLKLLNRQSTRGTASCYLAVDATGKTVLVANYTTGNVGSLPVREDGSLGEMVSFFQHAGSSVDLPRQKGPNAHSFVVSPDNRFAFAADLGIDQILSYRLDAATAKLTPNEPPFVKAPPEPARVIWPFIPTVAISTPSTNSRTRSHSSTTPPPPVSWSSARRSRRYPMTSKGRVTAPT